MRLYYRRFSLFNLFASAQGVFVLPSDVAALQRFSAGRPAFSPLIYPKHSWCRVFGTGQRSFLTREVLECRKARPQKTKKQQKKTFLHNYYCCFWFVVKQTYFISSIYSSFQLALFMWLRGDLYLRRAGEIDSPFPGGHRRMSNW
uniref:Putative secreted protein n=1 Tax=Ixodes ricinus TaxID=34613 RepID=A0A6B0UU88_IXORI